MKKNLTIFMIFVFSGSIVCTPTYSTVSTKENDFKQRKERINMADSNEELLEKLNDEERAWYDKFQEGMMFFSGWKEISEEILTSLPPDKRPQTQKILKTLGIRIGTEWSKDNSIRKIDTDMLRDWGKELKKTKKQGSKKMLEKLKEISSQVDQILAENSPNNQENKGST